ncbi:MarC family protein [Thioalkalivibrio sp. XN279]|uniref:MarC family protein n=1 Tax=Thioalkalivibrio sp. XN279 TaxID=2714953 RepID=UPI001407A0B9|nr:MarC family protein [Thioalkalivibrio sp. XN279]NHA13561.1 NAAT family transporter [Thioalkalivibrio sp. XN279]
MTEQLLKTFIIFFVVIEPVSLVPMFGALTRGGEPGYRKKMAFKSIAISAAIFIVFALAGDWLLRLLGISVSAFKIAGGILLFLLAVDMVLARESGLRSTTVREQDEARYREDISVFPMAFPLITGPGALATMLLLTAGAADWIGVGLVLAMGLLALAVTLVMLLLTQPLMRVIGVTGGSVISRLLGVVLSALAAQYVVDGITEVLV